MPSNIVPKDQKSRLLSVFIENSGFLFENSKQSKNFEIKNLIKYDMGVSERGKPGFLSAGEKADLR